MNKSATLLVVDDEPDLREIIADSLSTSGYTVLTAANGNDAFTSVRSNDVDVIVSDVRMPGGDGIDLLNKVKELDPMRPNVILTTGFSDITLEEAYNKGARDMISKPFDRTTLLAAVECAAQPADERWCSFDAQATPTMTIMLESTTNVNFGCGGIFVALSEKFPLEGTYVKFQIGDLGGLGVVRWVRQFPINGLVPGCGIEFSYLEEPSRKRFLTILSTLKPKSFIPIQ